MLRTITSSPAFLLQSVHLFIVRSLPLDTTIQTIFLFLMSYATWLIPLPALPHSGSCRHTTCGFRSTPVSSAAMAHSYDLALLCCITLPIGGSDSRAVSRFNADPHCHRSSCCRLCLHCRCCRHCALHHCDVLCLRSPFLCIGQLLFAPAPLSSWRVSSPPGQALSCSLLRMVPQSSWSILLVIFSSSPVPPWWPLPSLRTYCWMRRGFLCS